MNPTDDITQQALNRYNSLFDNEKYTAIAVMLANDLRADRESSEVSVGMNLITDMALSLSGHPHYDIAWLKLATFCGQNTVSIPTIDAIYSYLLLFQQVKDTYADDFEGTAKALLKAYETTTTLRTAVSFANGVHGWRGRMAYELLAAADYFTQAAIQLLLHSDLSYIREKLQAGLARITSALYEGVRYSDPPTIFDIIGTHFPDLHDRS